MAAPWEEYAQESTRGPWDDFAPTTPAPARTAPRRSTVSIRGEVPVADLARRVGMSEDAFRSLNNISTMRLAAAPGQYNVEVAAAPTRIPAVPTTPPPATFSTFGEAAAAHTIIEPWTNQEIERANRNAALANFAQRQQRTAGFTPQLSYLDRIQTNELPWGGALAIQSTRNLEEIGRGMARNVAQFPQMAVRGAEFVANSLQAVNPTLFDPTLDSEIVRNFRRRSEELSGVVVNVAEQRAPRRDPSGQAGWLPIIGDVSYGDLAGLGETIPTSAAAFHPAVLAFLGLSTAEEARRRGVETNLSKREAALFGGLTGALEVLTEKMDQITFRGRLGKLFPGGNMVGNLLKQGGVMGYFATNMIEQNASEALNVMAAHGLEEYFGVPHQGTLERKLRDTAVVTSMLAPLMGAVGAPNIARRQQLGQQVTSLLSMPSDPMDRAAQAARLGSIDVAGDLMEEAGARRADVLRWKLYATEQVAQGKPLDLNANLGDTPETLDRAKVEQELTTPPTAPAAPGTQPAAPAAPITPREDVTADLDAEDKAALAAVTDTGILDQAMATAQEHGDTVMVDAIRARAEELATAATTKAAADVVEDVRSAYAADDVATMTADAAEFRKQGDVAIADALDAMAKERAAVAGPPVIKSYEDLQKLPEAARPAAFDRIAFRDELTGLRNRVWAKVNGLMGRFTGTDGKEHDGLTPGDQGIIDIDHFRQVNNTYGHEAGDMVLRELGRALENALEGKADVIRFGGEEVSIKPLTGQDLRAIKEVVEDVRKKFSQLVFAAPDGRTFSVNYSGGFGIDFSTADKALYNAKAAGRGQIHDEGGRHGTPDGVQGTGTGQQGAAERGAQAGTAERDGGTVPQAGPGRAVPQAAAPATGQAAAVTSPEVPVQLYSGMPIDIPGMARAVIDSKTYQDTKAKLLKLGRAVYDAGATTWQAWHDRMRQLVGKAWERVQPMLRETWNNVRSYAVAFHENEYGYINPAFIGKVKEMLVGESEETQAALKKALAVQNIIDGLSNKIQFNPDKQWFEDNAEYLYSTDPDVICQRSAGTDAAINYLKNALGKDYTSDMGWEVLARIIEKKLPTPCPQCYVFSARMKPGGAMQKAYIVGVAGYNGEVMRFREAAVDDVTRRALRHFSSSDFKMEHIPGMIVELHEAMKRGIPAAFYSKVPDIAKIFGDTGAYINLSVGRNDLVGMNMQEAIRLRKKYPNVSLIYVAFTDAEVMRALRDPNIDHVIPWHSSGQSVEEIRKNLNDPDAKDFTSEQSEMVFIPSPRSKKGGKWVKAGGETKLSPKMVNQFTNMAVAFGVPVKRAGMVKQAPGRQIKEWEHEGDMARYLELCREAGVTPKFPSILKQLQGTKDEGLYMKLIGPEYGKFKGAYPYQPMRNLNINMQAIDEMVAAGSVMDGTNLEPYVDEAKAVEADVKGKRFEKSKGARVLEEGEFGGKKKKKKAKRPMNVQALIEDEGGWADVEFVSGKNAYDATVSMGRGFYMAGAKTWDMWYAAMKESAGAAWAKVQQYARAAYNAIRNMPVGLSIRYVDEAGAPISQAQFLAIGGRAINEGTPRELKDEPTLEPAERARLAEAEASQATAAASAEKAAAEEAAAKADRQLAAAERKLATAGRRGERAAQMIKDIRGTARWAEATVKANMETALQTVKDLLPPALQGKMLSDVVRARTQARVDKINVKAGELLEAEGQKADTRKMLKEMRKLQSKANAGQLKSIDPGYVQKIKDMLGEYDLKRGFREMSPEKEKELVGLLNYIQRNGVPFGLSQRKIDELDDLQKNPISRLSYEGMEELHNTLRQLLALGSLKKRILDRQAERIRQQELAALTATTTNYDVRMPRFPKLEKKLNELRRQAARWSFGLRFADTLDGNARYKGKNVQMVRELGQAVNKGEIETDQMFLSALEELKKINPDISMDTSTPEQQKYWAQITLKMLVDQNLWDQAQTLISYYGLEEADLDITEEQRAVAKVLQQSIGQVGPRIAAVERLFHGELFDLSPLYFPMKYRDYNPYDPLQEGTQKTFYGQLRDSVGQTTIRSQAPASGFTFERVPGVKKVPRIDLVKVLHESLAEQLHYVNTEPVMNRVKNLVLTEDYERAAGVTAMRWWENELDIVARRGRAHNFQSNEILRDLRGNVAKGILHYKLTTMALQPTAAFDAISMATSLYGPKAGAAIAAEVKRAFADRKATDEFILNRPDLTLRRGMAGEDVLREIRDERGERGEKQTWAGRAISFGDILTAAGAQKGFERILAEHGSADPVADAAMLMTLTNSTNNYAYRPHVFAVSDLMKTMLMFQSFSINRAGLFADDLIKKGVVDAARKGEWSRTFQGMMALGEFEAGIAAEMLARKGVRAAVAGVVGLALLAAGIEGPDDEDEETNWLADLASTNVGNIPYLGDIILAAVSKAGGFSRDVDNPMYRLIRSVFNGAVMGGKQAYLGLSGDGDFNARQFAMAVIDALEAGAALRGIPGSIQAGEIVRHVVRAVVPTGKQETIEKKEFNARMREAVNFAGTPLGDRLTWIGKDITPPKRTITVNNVERELTDDELAKYTEETAAIAQPLLEVVFKAQPMPPPHIVHNQINGIMRMATAQARAKLFLQKGDQ